MREPAIYGDQMQAPEQPDQPTSISTRQAIQREGVWYVVYPAGHRVHLPTPGPLFLPSGLEKELA